MDSSLINNDSFALTSFHSTYQPVAESPSDSATSPDPGAVAGVTLDIDSFARTTPLTTLATSTLPSSVPSTSAMISLQKDTVHAHSGATEIPSPVSPEPDFDNTLPTGTTPTLTLLAESNQWSYPESHSSIMARMSPGTSHG